MKFKNIDIRILESVVVGEFSAWNFVELVVLEFPKSECKKEILGIIRKRQIELMDSEVYE